MSQPREAAQEPPPDDPGAVDLDEAPVESRPRRTMRRLAASPMVRRLSPRKLLIGLGIVLALVMATGYVGLRLVRGAVAWLHAQPLYQVAFEEITLDPAPPSWIRSGAQGLLRQVHSRSRWRREATLPVLDVAPEELAEAFALGSPWVREVLAIEREYPNRVTVRLAYREPVARLKLGAGDAARTIYLDSDGVVLPADDLEVAEAGPLAWLELWLPRGAPLLERPGRALAAEPVAGADARTQVAGAACRLAALLKRENALAGTGTNRSPLLVEFLRENPSGLWIQTVERAMILWEATDGVESSEPMTGAQKWAVLQEWVAAHDLGDLAPTEESIFYLRFEDGLLRVYRARRDDAANRTGSIARRPVPLG